MISMFRAGYALILAPTPYRACCRLQNRRNAARSNLGEAALSCVLTFLLFAIQSYAQQSLQVLDHHVRPAVSSGQAKLVGPLPVTQQMRLSIVLPLRNHADLTSLLGWLYDPSSPDYRQFLSVEQFTERFGPTANDYQAVVDFANANGFTVTDTPANRRLVSIKGTVDQIQKTFHVKMNNYQHPTENRTFFSPDREPSLNLSVPVQHIAGLDNYSMPHPAYDVVASAPGGSYLSSDMRAAYYTSTLPIGATPLTGQGQIVGLFAISEYNINDVNMYFSTAGQTNSVPIVTVLLDGESGAPPTGSSPFQVEIELDMEMALGMAPGLSQLRVYYGNVFDDILNAMASENLARQLSTSVTWDPQYPQSNDDVFMEYAAQGQTFFSASGDAGTSSVPYPAEDIWVTGVGGTSLPANGGTGVWPSETAWGGSGGGYGSGGGPSPSGYALPSYQARLNGVNGASTTLRNAPDVSMNANNIYFCSFGGCFASGGTSASTPLWAGFMALVNQQAAASGEPPLGLLNPYIYAIGGGYSYNGINYSSSSYSNDFHDITIGNNECCSNSGFYNAGAGYDLVTGWGSPNGQNLINDLAPPAGLASPNFTLTASQGYLTIYTGSSGTSTITVNHWGGFTGSVNLSISGLPSGVTASWGTNPSSGTSVLTLTANSSAATNDDLPTLLTVTGTYGTLTATIYINLAITPETTNPPEGYVSSSVNFAAENIGSAGYPQTMTFTFDSSVTLGSISVLTQGVTGLDFANAGSGTCAPNTEFSIGQTCTVNVTFTPKFAGTRNGAVMLSDTNGNVIATGYLQGKGEGPQVNFLPNTESTVASQFSGGLIGPSSVAVDGSGNVYIADSGNNRIVKETLSAGSYTQSTIPTSTLINLSLAMDGAGNIYIADTLNQRVLKETPAKGGYTESVIASFPKNSGTFISAIAVDGSGNVYFVGGGTLYEETLSEGSYTQSILPTAEINTQGIAVDASGNIYIADNSNHQLVKLSAGSYTQTIIPISTPATPSLLGVAVDAIGNIYVSTDYVENQSLYSNVLKETLSQPAGTYTQTTIATGPLDGPGGIAVDGSGNVYIAGGGNNNVLREDFADPPSLSFPNTPAGKTSSAMAATLSNTGNGALNNIVPSITGANPSDFAISTGANACGATLAAGSGCSIYVTFSPSSATSFTATLSVSDSDASSPQTSALTGTGTVTAATLTSSLAFPIAPSGTTSTALAATLSNTGNGALNNIVPSITGANPSDFAISTGANACGTTLAAGSSCSIYVTFTPAAAASYSATLSVADSATSSPQISSLTGRGTAPAASLTPSAAFPNTPAGTTSSAIAATLSNTGNGALNNIVPTITGANTSDFAISTGASACSATLAAGSSCSIYVTFTPVSATSFSATLSVADSAAGSPQTSALSGTGTAAVSGVWPNGYNYQATFTVAAGQVPSAQTNFPALISGTYADFATTANGGRVDNTCSQTVGNNVTTVPCDLIFTSDSAGTQLLSWEYETYTAATGAVNIWVNIPNLANGTVIYAWYGQPSVTTLQSTPSATWSNYMAVYHMKENPAGAAPQLNDSTSNGNAATMNGPATASQQEPGEIDGSIGFTSNTWAGLSSSNAFSFERTDSFSISGWFNMPANTAGTLISKFPAETNAGWALLQATGNGGPTIELGLFGQNNGATFALAHTPPVTTGQWHYVVVTYSGTSTTAGMTIYVDGVQQSLTSVINTLSTSILNNLDPTINNRNGGTQESSDGMGELRVSAKGVVLTPAWVTASYNNESSPGTFFSVATGLTNQSTAPVASLSSSVAFPNTPSGTTSAALAATLSNTGNGALNNIVPSITGTNPSDFAISTGANACGATLAAGSSCSIYITFTPASATSFSATLSVADSATGSPQTSSLTGTGTTPIASLTASLPFPNTPSGATSAALAATLSNTGNGALNIIAPSITGINPSNFAISTGANACDTTLAAGSSCSIYITFTPASATSFSATLSVADSATGSPQTSALTGTGTAPAVSLTATLAFPSTTAGTTSSAMAATLSNTGNGALNNIVPTITGADPSDFALSTGANACGSTLAAGSSCSIYVTFTPAAATSYSATLSVADSATGSPQTSSLTGTGTSAAPTTWPNGYLYQATFTVAAGKVPSSQTNFPALISGTYADFATTANGGKVANACNQTVGNNVTSDPCDLIFTSDAAGTQLLSWEYETYSATTGAVNIWVNVPNLANGTTVYAWYGQPFVTTPQSTPSATWSNYMAVYHMKENPAGGAPQLNDSTGNGNNATMQGSPVAGQQEPGEIDGSIGFTTSTWANLPNTSAFSFERTDSFSLSGWIKIGANTSGQILTKQSAAVNSGWMLFQNPVGASPAIEFGLVGTSAQTLALARTPSISMGTWHYVVATYSGTSTTAGMDIYVDGVPQTLTTIENNLSTTILNNLTPTINSRATGYLESSDGMDELRVSAKGVVLTPAWVTASYNNESNPGTFFSVATGLTNP